MRLKQGLFVCALVGLISANVHAAIYADAGGPYEAGEGETVNFDGSGSYADDGCYISTYRWDIGIGGGYRYGITTSYVYSTPDTYTVTLHIDGYCGSSPVSDEDQTTVVVNNLPPTAKIWAFGYTNGGPFEGTIEEYVGRNITFDGTDSHDAAGNIVKYEWDLNYDGEHFNPDPRQTATINKAYSAVGTYVVALRITDDEGSQDLDTITVRILNLGPIARISGPESFPEGESRVYSAASSDPGPAPPISLYEWDLDYDGEEFSPDQSGEDLDHITVQFDNAGTYAIALRVYDSYNPPRFDTAVLTVTVENVPPVAALSGPQSFPEGSEQVFSAADSVANPGYIVRYEWNFDYDGQSFGAEQTTVEPTVVHAWEDDGTYTVAVRVVDDDGSADIATLTVEVTDLAPEAVLVCPEHTQEREPAYFDASASSSFPDQIVGFEWDFNYDGENFDPEPDYAGPTAGFTFPDAGVFTVAVRVIDDDGSASIATCTVNVADEPPVAIISAPYTANEGDTLSISGEASIEASRPDTIAAWEWDPRYDGETFRPDEELTGRVSFELVPPDDGSYTIALRITDDDGSQTLATHTIEVANVPPRFVSQPIETAVEDELYTYQVRVEDPAGPEDPLTFSLEVAPDGMEINEQTGKIVWVPTNDHVRLNNRVKIKVCDDDGGCATQSFQIVVENRNDPPEIIGLTNTVATTCEPFFATVRARDPDWGDTLYFYLDEAPEGMSIDLRSGDITWQPTVDFLGENQITVRVEDGNGGVATDYFTINVYPCGEIPEVDAGEDITTRPGLITLHGRATDPHDPPLPLTYRWTQTSGEPVQIQGADSLEPVVILRKSGEYVFTLVADNGQYESIPDSVTVTVLNVEPIAGIVCSPVIAEGERFILDGSFSGDMNAEPLEYSWSSNEGIEILEDGFERVEAKANSVGAWKVGLRVTDGELTSEQAETYVVVRSDSMFPPVAAVESPVQNIYAGERALLDASPSVFPSGSGIERTFEWHLISGPVAEEDLLDFDPSARTQELLLIEPGLYLFELVARANELASKPAQVWVAVGETDNLPPVANAGRDFFATIESFVSLDGSGSTDPEGDPLSYLWVQTAGPTVDLDDPSSAQPTFFALNPGVLEFELRVTDNRGLVSVPDRVRVAIIPQGLQVAACAGEDFSVNPDEEVMLDATCTQAAEDATIVWCQQSGEPVVLEDSDTLTPHFLPPRPGTYTFQLWVKVGEYWGLPDEVSVTVLEEPNQPPVAEAGGDRRTNFGLKVVLDGSASYDPDGDSLQYAWRQLPQSAGEVELHDANTAQAWFYATAEGVLVFELKVYDGKMWSEPDTVAITVNPNQRPVANAGDDRQVYTGDTVQLDGSASYDPDGEGVPLLYQWRFLGEGENPLDDPTSPTPSFVPQRQGEYRFELVVSDGYLESEPDEVSVIVLNRPDDSCLDRDGDGYGEGPGCLGPDCDDLDKDKNPGIPGSCEPPGFDEDTGKSSSGGGCATEVGLLPWVLALGYALVRRRRL